MIKLISLVSTLTQTRMGVGRVTFPSMGAHEGAICLPCDKSQSFHIYFHLLFLAAPYSISLKCACLLVWNVHVLRLKQECVLGSVTLPNKGPLRDQYVFVMVKFYALGFLFQLVFLETLYLISLKVNYKGILVYEILMDCVARKRIQKTTSNYLKWFPRYCDLNFYKLSH